MNTKLPFSLLTLLSSLLVVVACGGSGQGDEAGSNIPQEFRLVSENVDDIPIKTQVIQNIVVSGKITEEKLRDILRHQHDDIAHRTGFRYHDSPTNIYIYLFDTEDRANADQLQAILLEGVTNQWPF